MRAFAVLCLVAMGCLGSVDATNDGPDEPQAQAEQASTTPALSLARTYVTDGYIHAATLDGNTLYVGGYFRYIGQRSGEVALVSASTGTRSTFPAIGGGYVSAILSDGKGGYFFGGDFRRVGSLSTRGLAHLRSDGTWDPAWKFQITGSVRTLARDSSRLYVGGSFVNINGQSRTELAVLDLATGTVLPPAPRLEAPVSSIAVTSNYVFVAIDASDGAEPGGGVVRLDGPSLTQSTWNPGGFDGPVSYVLAYGSGLYVAGSFTHVGSLARGHVASIDQATAAVRPYNPNTDLPVFAIQRVGTTLYLVGQFTTVGGQPRSYVAAVNASTGAVLPWHPDTTGMEWASVVYATSSAVYVGGVGDGDVPTSALAFDASSAARLAWDPRPNAAVYAIAPHPSGLLLGGYFTSTGGSLRRNLAAIDITTGKATSWAPVTDADPGTGVWAMTRIGSAIYVAGTFSSLGGQPRAHLGAISTSGSVLPFRADTDALVEALAAIGTTVYLGGQFTTVGGVARDRLAAVDATSGALRSWNPGTGPHEVITLLPVGSTVYVGGNAGLAAYDGSTGAARPAPAVSGYVYGLGYDGSHVFVGGAYSTIGGVSRNSLASIDPNTATVTSWNPAVPQYQRFYAVAASPSYVYAQDDSKLYTLDQSTGAVESFSPRFLNARSDVILPLSDRLILVGAFHDIDNIGQQNIAMYLGTP